MSVDGPQRTPGDHPQDLSLREQAHAVASGELDATELLDATLGRIEERDGAINSIVDVFASESARMLSEAPDLWKIDVPNTLTAEKLKANVLAHLTAANEMKDQWPADVNQASASLGRLTVSNHAAIHILDEDRRGIGARQTLPSLEAVDVEIGNLPQYQRAPPLRLGLLLTPSHREIADPYAPGGFDEQRIVGTLVGSILRQHGQVDIR